MSWRLSTARQGGKPKNKHVNPAKLMTLRSGQVIPKPRVRKRKKR